jgi:hypothetical protein
MWLKKSTMSWDLRETIWETTLQTVFFVRRLVLRPIFFFVPNFERELGLKFSCEAKTERALERKSRF